MAVKVSDETSASTPEWETIEQVFAALESPLLAYARRLLGDFAVAEDIVQEAFMKLHTQFQKVLTPQPWLYRTVHNLAVDGVVTHGDHHVTSVHAIVLVTRNMLLRETLLIRPIDSTRCYVGSTD